MTRPAVVVGTETTFHEMTNLLRRHRISGLPVVDQRGLLVGVVSEGDLLHHLVRAERRRLFEAAGAPMLGVNAPAATGETAADLMSRPAVAVAPDTSVDVTLELMRRRALRRLPVVDPEGHVVGIVSRTDFLQPHARTDVELRDELLTGVLPKLGVPSASVRLDIENGNVLIGGSVDSAEVAGRVERAVRDTAGVVSVESCLRGRRPHARAAARAPR